MKATAIHSTTPSFARAQQEKTTQGNSNRPEVTADQKNSFATTRAEIRAHVADERMKIGKYLNAKV